jgi:hypothetical protein
VLDITSEIAMIEKCIILVISMEKTTLFSKNPSLSPLTVLIGTWTVEMSHVALPTPLTWQDSFEWLDNAFIIWHWEGKNEVPGAKILISRNENKPINTYSMFYYDTRGVSRIFDMSFDNGIWKFWREDADFFQRFEGTISEDGDHITGKGENSSDGKKWEHDFSITYTRIT